MKITNLQDLLLDEMKDMLHAENQLIKALPKLAKLAESEELRTGLEEHLAVTRTQKERLEQLLTDLTGSARPKPCKGMQGILEEGNELMDEIESASVCDAALIAASQKVEHYEIASYGTMVAWAEKLGLTDVAGALGESLEEEEEADRKLTEIAESLANEEAAEGDDEKDDEKDEEETEDTDAEEREPATARARSSAPKAPPARSRRKAPA